MRITPDPAASFASGFRPVDNTPLPEWAHRNITLPASYAIPGQFSVAPSRYLIEPLLAMQSHDVRRVTVSKPVQSGGTLIADLSVPWFVAHRPGPVLWCMQTEEIAETHAISRAVPVMQSCQDLRALFPSDPRKANKGGVEFPHCPVWIEGATPAQLQSRSVLLLICDELWLWPAGRLEWALARVTAFERVGLSKVLAISQPGAAGDDFDLMFKAGTQEEWTVACTHCHEHFLPEWSGTRSDGSAWGMMWDTNPLTRPDGQWHFPEVAKTIRFECPRCGGAMHDSPQLKAAWNASGQYLATNPTPEPHHRSFRWSSIMVDPWDALVRRFLAARDQQHAGIDLPMRTFQQQRLAKPYDPEATPHDIKLVTETFDVKSSWDAEVVRFITVDVQENHYWLEVRAWAADGESRQLAYAKVFSEADILAKCEEFQVQPKCVAIDTGYDARRIYEMILRNGWLGLKGEDVESFTIRLGKKSVQRAYSDQRFGDPMAGKAGAGRRFAKFFLTATLTLKRILFRLRDGKGVRWASLPDREYEQQMFAEVRRRKQDRRGRDTWVFAQVRRDNHAIDTGAMQICLALMHPKIALSEQTLTEPSAETPIDTGVSDAIAA